MKPVLIIITALFINVGLFAQSVTDIYPGLKYKFETFQFREFIDLADSLLQQNSAISLQQKNEILKMKGVAYFYLWQEDSSAIVFREVLKAEPGYEPDTVSTSPKIVSFFRKVKEEFLKNYKPANSEVKKDSIPLSTNKTTIDTVGGAKKQDDGTFLDTLKTEILRNKKQELKEDVTPAVALIPGYVQIRSGNEVLGWIFAAGSALSAVTAIAYSIDYSSKEKEYLQATTAPEISDKYSAYNSSYKIRNYALSAFVAFFTGSLLDNFLWNRSKITLTMAGKSAALHFQLTF